jgi:hypothetical protein
MGTIQHKSMILVGDDQSIEELHALAERFNRQQESQEESPVPVTRVFPVGNGYYTFAVMPTGSKVGWPYHQAGVDLMDGLATKILQISLRDGAGGAHVEAFRAEWGEMDPRWEVLSGRQP